MEWSKLKSVSQLDQIKEESQYNPVLIFKYSSRCSISQMALDRLERNWKSAEMQDVKSYFLDLISYREISNRVAHEFDVEHESPQILVIEKGKSIYNRSHMGIDYQQIREAVRN